MIEVKNLTKRYKGEKNDVIHEASFSLPDRGLVFLIGKSGCGKSTLRNLLSCIDEEYKGSIQYNGKELKERTEREKADYRFSSVSIAFQSFRQTEEESVYVNRLKPLAIRKRTREEKKKKIFDALKRVGLLDKKDRKFKDLSGGEKKRISLAVARIKDTPVLFADEPLASLNKEIRRQRTSLLLYLSLSRLVFVITHEKDEVPEQATVYEREKGKRNLLRKGKEGKGRTLFPVREKYKGFSRFYQILNRMAAKRSFLFRARRTFVLGLFSVSFSFQLSMNVSASLTSSREEYRENDSMIVESSEEGVTGTSFQMASNQVLNLYRRNHSDEVLSKGYFFTTSRNDIFGPDQSFILTHKEKSRDRNRISLDSLVHSLQREEKNADYYGEAPKEKEDLLLGLTEENLLSLSFFLFGKKETKLNEEERMARGEEFKRGNVFLDRKAEKSEWKYSYSQRFCLRGFFLSETPLVLSSGPDFPLWLVHEQRGFLVYESGEEKDLEKPWSRERKRGLKLRPNKAKGFLKSFLSDKDRDKRVPEVFQTPYYYLPGEVTTHNHILLYEDILPKVSLSSIGRFVKDNQGRISSVSYSSSVYTYTASGYISGFTKPFFFSRNKEKLNEIQDNYAFTSENLGQFQAAGWEREEGVRKADLLSSMDGEGRRFVSLSSSRLTPLMGDEPKSIEEIGLSEGRAKKLFSSSSLALGKQINTLTLFQTVKEGDKYKNLFAPGSLTVSAVYPDEGRKIYQDSLFPLCYYFSLGTRKKEECRISEAVIKTDLERLKADDYIKRVKDYGNFRSSYPRLVRIEEIDRRRKRLSLLFLSFSFVSLVSALTLLSLSRYLLIKKEQKEIGISLSFGYRKKEVVSFYLHLALLLGLISYILSFFLSLFTQKARENALMDVRNSSTFLFTPFLISFLLGCLVLFFVALLRQKIRMGISPKDAFSH